MSVNFYMSLNTIHNGNESLVIERCSLGIFYAIYSMPLEYSHEAYLLTLSAIPAKEQLEYYHTFEFNLPEET